MTTWLVVLTLGFVLGMRHAIDPDHVLAVATIVARHRTVRDAALIGICWGVGHTLTILLVGGGIVLFSWVIPPRLGLSLEFSVGIMLILLGIMTLLRVSKQGSIGAVVTGRPAPGAHVHSHGDYIHTHRRAEVAGVHPHEPERTPLAWIDRRFARLSFYQVARPLVIGMVHGLAGSAAVALLVLTTISTPSWSLIYLLVFGAGTIAGMMLVTGAIALPFAYTNASLPALTRGLGFASGVAALGFGCMLAYHVGFVDGLFTATPQWLPR